MVSRNITRRGDKWRARYRDEAGREHARHFDRKLDGQRWLDEVTASIVSGTYVDPRAGAETMRSYFAAWAQRQLWEQGTTVAMTIAIEACSFVDVPLGRVKRSHVEAWVKSMSSTFAASTVRTRFNNVRSVLKAAVRDRVIASDPSEGVVLPRRRRTEHAMVVPSPELVRAAYEAIDVPFRPLVALGAFAGLRLGEINGMQVRDIDFLRRTIHVRRQVQKIAGRPVEIRAPKYGSERDVPASDGLLERLARHLEEFGSFGDEGWLFLGRDGGPAWPAQLAYRWNKVGSRNHTIHDLRHFYASGLIAAGCDVVTVQHALGHKSATVTLNTYAHLWKSADDRTRTASAGLVDAVFEIPADSVRTAAAE